MGILPAIYLVRGFAEIPLQLPPGSLMFRPIMSLLASFMNLAGPDLIVILLIILVLFGAKKLPELARGMGQAVREFQKAKDEFSDEMNKAGKAEEKTVRPAQASVPRIESGTTGTQPDPNQAVAPGNRADQV
jgi:sec-independent protein translocase protein TatA